MNFLNNQLTVNLQGWPVFMRRRTDKRFHLKMRAVLERDRYICQYCGFRAQKFQQIVNNDRNYANNSMSNLRTCCLLCSKCHFLGSEDSGKIVLLPEFSQAELNNLSRVLFCLMATEGQYTETAKSLLRLFRHRAKPVEEQFGQQMSEPMVFAYCYVDINQSLLVKKNDVLRNLRLLPSPKFLEKPVKYWSSIIMPSFEEKMLSTIVLEQR